MCTARDIDDPSCHIFSNVEVHPWTIFVHGKVVHQCPDRPRHDAVAVGRLQNLIPLLRIFSLEDDMVDYNYRMPPLNEALGCEQMKKLPKVFSTIRPMKNFLSIIIP